MTWIADAPLKVKVFAWSMAHIELNTNDLIQRMSSNASLLLLCCFMCWSGGEGWRLEERREIIIYFCMRRGNWLMVGDYFSKQRWIGGGPTLLCPGA